MAIHIEHEEDIQQGIAKVIDDSGAAMVFAQFQKYQYNHPIRSTVRELLSNGVDSVGEKNMAKAILTGKAKVSDYFVEMEGKLYKDSKWTPDYYDLKWLSDSDNVSLTYLMGTNMSKDKVIIADNGVGLGGKRLEGYFRIAYSTKRLQKGPLGKFGVGAKSPLSTGVPFYTMETRYNGQLFRFNIYLQNFTPIIPQYNLEAGEENKFVLFNEGTEQETRVYYEKTTSKNGVTITIDAKSHHKPQYLDAVKSQMLYFDNIICQVLNNGQYEKIDYKAKILYEDEYIIMSDNNYFTQPHLLLNKVNYGFINWDELELETKRGNIGIKVAPEDVDVSPSRESVIWSDPTKQMVLQRFNKVVEIASDFIQKELMESDIIRWLRSCYQISGRGWANGSGVLARLAQIVDLSKISPKFIGNPKLEFKYTAPLPGIYTRFVEKAIYKYSDKEDARDISRSPIESLQGKLDKPLFLFRHEDRASNRKDKWLFTIYPSGFTLMHEPYGSRQEMEESDAPEYMKKFYAETSGTGIFHREIWDLLQESSEVLWYDKVEVPEDWSDKGPEKVENLKKEEEEKTEEEVKQAKIAALTAAERRKLEGKTVIHMLQTQGAWQRRIVTKLGDDGVTVINRYDEFSAYEFNKIEVPIKFINEWSGEVYYGNDADSETLNLVAMLTRDPSNTLGTNYRSYANNQNIFEDSRWWRFNKNRVSKYGLNGYQAFTYQHFFDSAVTLVKVSQSNNKLYRDFRHVQEFFFQIKNKTTITMSNLLVQWNTARVIYDKLPNLAFLYNFEEFNPEYAEMYDKLCVYVSKHYREVAAHNNGNTYGLSGDTYKDLLSHLDKVRQFQEFVMQQNEDPVKVSELAKELFGNPDLRDGMAIDPEMMRVLNKAMEFSVACGEMLNYMPCLTGYSLLNKAAAYNMSNVSRSKASIPQEVSMEIRGYLEYRGVDKFGKQLAEDFATFEAQDLEHMETALLVQEEDGTIREAMEADEFLEMPETF